jgi:hypothetical protein
MSVALICTNTQWHPEVTSECQISRWTAVPEKNISMHVESAYLIYIRDVRCGHSDKGLT